MMKLPIYREKLET